MVLEVTIPPYSPKRKPKGGGKVKKTGEEENLKFYRQGNQ